MQADDQREGFITQLYENSYDMLEKMCYRHLHYNAQFADLISDCVQETFMAAHRHYASLRDHPNPEGWLVKTCQNRLKDGLRREKSRGQHRAYSMDATQEPTLADALSAIDAWESRQHSEETLQQLTSLLTQREQRVMEGYFKESLPMGEVARQEQTTVGAVKSLIHRIRQKARGLKDDDSS